jgi:hypothetical protein
MDSHGGLTASAIDVLKFATAFDQREQSPILSAASIDEMYALPAYLQDGKYVVGEQYYALGWAMKVWENGRSCAWHNGSLPGTFTLMLRRSDGIDFVALFNQRDDPSGLNYRDIDAELQQVCDSIKDWPDHNLFEQYVPTV